MPDPALSQLIHAILYIVLYFPLGNAVQRYFDILHPISLLYSPVLPLLLGSNLAEAVGVYFK